MKSSSIFRQTNIMFVLIHPDVCMEHGAHNLFVYWPLIHEAKQSYAAKNMEGGNWETSSSTIEDG